MNDEEYRVGALADFISNEVASKKRTEEKTTSKKKKNKKEASQSEQPIAEDDIDVTEIFKKHSSSVAGKVYRPVALTNEVAFQSLPKPKLSNKQAASIRLEAKKGVKSKSELLFSAFAAKSKKRRKAEKEDDSEEEEDLVEKDKKPDLNVLNAPKEKNLEQEKRTVFLGNVPSSSKKKEFIKLCKPFGKIEAVRFRGIAPAKPNMSKRLAANKNQLHPERNSISVYVRFSSIEEAMEACENLNGAVLHDQHIRADIAYKDVPKEKKFDNKQAVFVGNLHLKIEDDELWNFFHDCGEIRSVRVIRDSKTGLGKGFGYVNFMNIESIAPALKKDGSELKGRPIRVSKAVKKLKEETVKTMTSRIKKEKNTVKPHHNGVRKPDRKKRDPVTGKKLRHRDRVVAETADNSFVGDQFSLEETKKKHKKPSKDEIRRNRIARTLTGISNKKQKMNSN